MKRHYFWLAALILTATAAAASGEETVPGRPLVSTTGTAEVRIVPDLADLVFQVEVRNVNLTQARKEEAERVAKVLAALRNAGIAEAELQTSQVEIAPRYDQESANGRAAQESTTARFYSVSQYIVCTLHDVKKIANVTADAITAGVTGIHGANLRTSELRKYTATRPARRQVELRKRRQLRWLASSGQKSGAPMRSQKMPPTCHTRGQHTLSKATPH